jgi:hypothetical protein
MAVRTRGCARYLVHGPGRVPTVGGGGAGHTRPEVKGARVLGAIGACECAVGGAFPVGLPDRALPRPTDVVGAGTWGDIPALVADGDRWHPLFLLVAAAVRLLGPGRLGGRAAAPAPGGEGRTVVGRHGRAGIGGFTHPAAAVPTRDSVAD